MKNCIFSLKSSLLLILLTFFFISPVSATVVDLADTNVTSGSIDGVTFIWDQQQPTGTGVLDPFLRVQKNGTEQGYNTTVANAGLLPFEDKFGSFTHDVKFSDLSVIDGYYKFVLDIGEPVSGTQSLISLDGLKLFSTDTGGQNSSLTDGNGDASGISGTLLWDMDAIEDSYVMLDANRNGKPGNGVSDMLMLVPESVFSSVPVDEDYFILWSRFGLQETSSSGSESFGTFEEWASLSESEMPPVPEPATFILLGGGLVGLAFYRRKQKR